MGKLQSKHGECILVNTQIGSSLGRLSDLERFSDGGWPDFSFDQSVWQKMLNNQEVSVCLKGSSPQQQQTTPTNVESELPLRVSLPPEKMADHSSAKLFTMDQCCNKKLNDLETTTDDNKTLNVEEFECGVSVAGSDKQEWSFTLYDFDGKGKITKEDLGSLLRSLYDAVGSSINLPKSGTKTLKLRLTVSPDHSKVTQRSPDEKKDKNDCRKETNNKTKESKLNKDLDNSKLSAKEEKLDNISKAEQLSAQAASAAAGLVVGQELKVHHKEVKNNLSQPGKATASSGKPKLTSLEQRHLAELVQKNMERHQQRLQQRHQKARRHNSDVRKHHSHTAANNHTCEESRDRRNYYLDLAGIENHDTAKLHNTSAPAELLSPRLGKREHSHRSRDAKLRSRSHNSRRQHTDGPMTAQQDNVHLRSRSHDVSKEQSRLTKCEKDVDDEEQIRLIELAVEEKAEKCVPATTTTLTSTPNGKLTLLNAKSASPTSPADPTTTTPATKNHKLRPVSLPPNIPESVSPHHHRRHRNRDRNRKLAMQQVAEWIEREHSWNCEQTDQQHVVIQRHEHHHIHEHHHHHHYHHYHET